MPHVARCSLSSSARLGNQWGAASPAVSTTLYDVLATLQELLPPEEDAVVVALVARWLRNGRLRFASGPERAWEGRGQGRGAERLPDAATPSVCRAPRSALERDTPQGYERLLPRASLTGPVPPGALCDSRVALPRDRETPPRPHQHG